MAKPTKKTEVNPDAEVQTNVQAEVQTPLKQKAQPAAKPTYEEWKVEIRAGENGPVFEKLKKIREGITITEEQAAILNDGMLRGGNSIASMYFLPE